MSSHIYNPIADEKAIILFGDIRITVLRDSLLRIEKSKSRVFRNNPTLAFVNRLLTVPNYNYEISEDGKTITVTTKNLCLEYKQSEGSFSKTNLKISYQMCNKTYIWHPGLTDEGNLKGTTRTLDGCNGSDNVTLENSIISRDGWAIIDDTGKPEINEFDPYYVKESLQEDYIDWYFFGYGHEYKKALNDFIKVSGKIALPPKFAFGYWWSKYWCYSEHDLRGLVADFEDHNLPLSVLVIDMDWHDTYGITAKDALYDKVGEIVGWTGYSWNKELFPNPKSFIDWLHKKGIKVALNIHPASGIMNIEDKYNAFKNYYEGSDESSDRDTVYNAEKTYDYNLEDSRWAKAYFETIIKPLEEEGVDFWWIDWQNWLESKNIKNLSNTLWLNHSFFMRREIVNNKRGIIFHRWGGLGNHRYPLGFSGDTIVSEESLSYQPYFTSTAGNVGYGYWGHDIGGHMGEAPTPELYLRWLQFGALSPIFRTHATKSSKIKRKIWDFPEYYEEMKDTFKLRMNLIPYLYTTATNGYTTGLSVIRPLYWDYPESDNAYNFTHEYMLGDNFIIAPITETCSWEAGFSKFHSHEQNIWLPKSDDWYDIVHHVVLKSGDYRILEDKFRATIVDDMITMSYDIDEIPMFVKAGSIIPILEYKKTNFDLTKPFKEITLNVYPGGDGWGELYDDDGESKRYKDGVGTRRRFDQKRFSDLIIITFYQEINPASGKLFENIRYKVKLIDELPPKEIRFNGELLDFTYLGNELAVEITLPEVNSEMIHNLVITRATEDLDLSGIAFYMKRLRKISNYVNETVNNLDGFANSSKIFQKMANLGMNFAYNPKSVYSELEGFYDILPQVVSYMASIDTLDLDGMESVMKMISPRDYFAEAPVISYTFMSEELAYPEKLSIDPNFDLDVNISLRYNTKYKAEKIRFTLDGTVPTLDSFCSDTFAFTRGVYLLKARTWAQLSQEDKMIPSAIREELIWHKWGKEILFEPYPNYFKKNKSPEEIVLGNVLGNSRDFREGWIGYEENHAVFSILLNRSDTLQKVGIRYLIDQEHWIFAPKYVEFSGSQDGINYFILAEKELSINKDKDSHAEVCLLDVTESRKIKYLQVRIMNIEKCPQWHRGKGENAWMFIDNILTMTK